MKTLRMGATTLIALAFLLPMTTLAEAPARSEANRIQVSFADLNINNTAGAKVLYARLQRASEAACKVEPYRLTGSIERFAKVKQCYEDTLDSFVVRIDSDALTRLHTS
jgi:UrcA family protein